jgi:hypothetical protein
MSERALKSERLQMVISPGQLERIENWRRQQSKIPSFSEAVRQLIDLGLAAARDDDKAPYDPGPRQKVKT